MGKEITGRYVTVDNTRIYFDECGEGIPLLCIHTAGACSLEYRHFMPIMAENGFRVVGPDLPGHGKSYPVGWGPIREMHQYAEFVWKVGKAIFGGEKIVVLGMSIGGDMSLDIACHHSEELLAAVVMEGAGQTPTFANTMEIEHPHACPGFQELVDRGSTMSVSHPCAEEILTELTWQHRFACQEIGTADLQCWSKHDCREQLPDIKCPTLIFRGEDDYYVPEELVDDTLARIPSEFGEKVIVKEVGHYPAFEKPEFAAKIVLDFLARRGIGRKVDG